MSRNGLRLLLIGCLWPWPVFTMTCGDHLSLEGFGMRGKTVIVTGGSRGIGRKVVEQFATAGAKVLFTYQSSSNQAEELLALLRAKGHEAHGFAVDVRDPEACRAFVEAAERQFEHVDVLVNNAGITKEGLLITLKDESWDSVLDCNLGGCFHMTRPVARHMLRNRSGAIINISSVAAQIPNRGQASYSASKGAIESLTRVLAQELGKKNIRVNAVAPGYIETEMTEALSEAARAEALNRPALGRMGSTEDVAHTVIFLASDFASYITGAVVPVDGGYQ